MVKVLAVTVASGLILASILWIVRHIGKWIMNYSKSNNASIDHDIKLFKKFLEVLPSSSPSIYFLKEHDFGNSFSGDSRDDIKIFLENWETAEYRFLDKNIELAKNKLIESCKNFIAKLPHNSWRQGSGGFYTTLPEEYNNMTDVPEAFIPKIKNLHDIATDCFNMHQSFISLCKKKLKTVT